MANKYNNNEIVYKNSKIENIVGHILNNIDNKVRFYHIKTKELMISKPLSFLCSCLKTGLATTKHFYSTKQEEGLAIWLEFLCAFVEIIFRIELMPADIEKLKMKLIEIYKEFDNVIEKLKEYDRIIETEASEQTAQNVEKNKEMKTTLAENLEKCRELFINEIERWITDMYDKYDNWSRKEKLEFVNFVEDVENGISWVDDCAKYIWLMYHIVGSVYHLSNKNAKCFLLMIKDLPLLIGCSLCKIHYISTCFPLFKNILLLNSIDNSQNKLDEIFIKLHSYINLSFYYEFSKNVVSNEMELESKSILDEDVVYLYDTYLNNMKTFRQKSKDVKTIAILYRQYGEEWYNLYF